MREASDARDGDGSRVTPLPDKVFVPSPASPAVADTLPAEERYEDGYRDREPPESDDTPLSYGPFYGGPFVPPPVLSRNRVRIRS
jgi:hypothetical protein